MGGDAAIAARVAAFLLALVAWCASLVALFSAIIVVALTCDDSCYRGEGWRHAEHAWQWDAILALGIFVFVVATAFVVCIGRRRRLGAAAAFAIGVAAAVVLLRLVLDDWRGAIGRHPLTFVGIALAGVVAPAVALALAPRQG